MALQQASALDRITSDAQTMGGRACIRGADFEEILQDYPDLEYDDIAQALKYAAQLTAE